MRRFYTARSRRRPLYLPELCLGGAILGGALYATDIRRLFADLPKSHEQVKSEQYSQHAQVKSSWESPGVYACGNNKARVVAPDATDDYIKSPKPMTYFSGKVLRDLVLDRTVGVAVDQDGDVMQWGDGYSPAQREPEYTLVGKKITQVSVSKERIYALASSGNVYCLPFAKTDLLYGPKPYEASWIPLVGRRSNISYVQIKPSLQSRERVRSVVCGLDHALLMTSAGRVFSTTASNVPLRRGQFGVVHDATAEEHGVHEIATLDGFRIRRVAAGDYHSVVADDNGRVWTFGDNTYGQLCFDFTPDTAMLPLPTLLPLQSLLYSPHQTVHCGGLGAGGSSTYLVRKASASAKQPTPTIDVWASGAGLSGQLGNGRWLQTQGKPIKIKSLSGLFEFHEGQGRQVPIGMWISCGSAHCAAVLGNITKVDAGGGRNDVNYGRDVLLWGANESFQLGTGKRNNLNVPSYVPPLGQAGGRQETHRLQLTPATSHHGLRFEQAVVAGRGTTGVYSRLVGA